MNRFQVSDENAQHSVWFITPLMRPAEVTPGCWGDTCWPSGGVRPIPTLLSWSSIPHSSQPGLGADQPSSILSKLDYTFLEMPHIWFELFIVKTENTRPDSMNLPVFLRHWWPAAAPGTCCGFPPLRVLCFRSTQAREGVLIYEAPRLRVGAGKQRAPPAAVNLSIAGISLHIWRGSWWVYCYRSS